MGHDEGGDDGKRDTFVSPLLERERERRTETEPNETGKKLKKAESPKKQNITGLQRRAPPLPLPRRRPGTRPL